MVQLINGTKSDSNEVSKETDWWIQKEWQMWVYQGVAGTRTGTWTSPVRVAQCRETVIYQLTCPTQPWLPRIPKYPYSLDLRHEERAHGLFGTRQPSAPGTGPV